MLLSLAANLQSENKLGAENRNFLSSRERKKKRSSLTIHRQAKYLSFFSNDVINNVSASHHDPSIFQVAIRPTGVCYVTPYTRTRNSLHRRETFSQAYYHVDNVTKIKAGRKTEKVCRGDGGEIFFNRLINWIYARKASGTSHNGVRSHPHVTTTFDVRSLFSVAQATSKMHGTTPLQSHRNSV